MNNYRSMYNTWRGMIYRCTDKNHNAYHNYGGRGIKVCDRWFNNFYDFVADMGDRPKGKSLDRIDCDGNYELGNCRWASAKEQQRNRRNTVYLTYKNKTLSVND